MFSDIINIYIICKQTNMILSYNLSNAEKCDEEVHVIRITCYKTLLAHGTGR